MKRGGFQLCTLQCPASVRLCEGDAGLVSLGTRVLGLPKLELKTKRKHEGVLIDFHIPSIEHSLYGAICACMAAA